MDLIMNFSFLFVPSILFIIFVMPLWLVLHYRHKKEMSKGITREEIGEIEEMLEHIDKLSERVENLEKILKEK